MKEKTISIGAVSTATGIPISTLRTWERRYGFPMAERSEGGQRLYNVDIIRHLRLVNDALKQGFRPKQVMTMPLEELQNLVGTAVEHPVWEGMNEGGLCQYCSKPCHQICNEGKGPKPCTQGAGPVQPAHSKEICLRNLHRAPPGAFGCA